MRLKNSVVMTILLTTLLTLTLIGGINYKSNKPELKPKDEVEPTIEPDKVVIPDSFLGTFNDEYGVDEDIKKLIVSYIDDYYMSMFTLEQVDTSDYFSNEMMSNISDKAIKLVLEAHKLYDFDFTMTKAHYDLKVVNYYRDGDLYCVDLYEDDYFNYAFLPGIESSAYEIENYFKIKKVDDEYKIEDLEKVQGYYLSFYDDCETIDEVNNTYDYFMEQLHDMKAYNEEILKVKAESTPYMSKKSYTGNYDRNKAVEYSYLYYHERNKDWYNFQDEGGNCQNYASQCLLTGGIPMDYTGDLQWKCYITDPIYEPEINGEEEQAGRTRSWVNVGYFYNYALNNEGKGLVAEPNANIYYAEPGDIIMVGNYGLSHTVIVSKVVEGHILVNSNSIDMKDYPLEAYTYTNITLIKINGYN